MSRKSSKSSKTKDKTTKQTFCSFCGGEPYLHPNKKTNGDVDMSELLEEGGYRYAGDNF